KSQDDEFLMMLITATVGGNSIAFRHLHTKVKRALARKSYTFFEKQIMNNPEEFVLTTKNGIKFPVLKGKIDTDRLIKCFEHIAYGLYYHEFGKVFEGECKLFIGTLLYQENNQKELLKMIKKLFSKDVDRYNLKAKGENPEIFKYVFIPQDENGLIGLKMVIYNGIDVYFSFKNKDIPAPFDFGMQCINGGIKTNINIDGEKFEFNKD
ncbi:MAG: hypothetical protein ACK5KN_14990, partial [Dysgonomonas sp.]|uniref:hypothetical protein n=1 Tax=Dysgonomonas sp. TaxID=1891233 RepID=UPI003A89295E